MENKMIESRKQAVSIRMNGADVRKVKKLAQRLGARDSDVIRFAVKSMLTRLAPLYDPQVRGRNLVPVFVEAGVDLLRFFDLDASRLETIINEGTEHERLVERDDIALLALTGAASAQTYPTDHGTSGGAVNTPSVDGPGYPTPPYVTTQMRRAILDYREKVYAYRMACAVEREALCGRHRAAGDVWSCIRVRRSKVSEPCRQATYAVEHARQFPNG